MSYSVHAHRVLELAFTAARAHRDPFNEIELDVLFHGAGGEEVRVPAFWGGGAGWRARFSAPHSGHYTFETICSDPADHGLHGQRGEVEVLPALAGEANPFYAHGAVRVRSDRRGFEHADGKPFLWMGDTWWMALGGRLSWPEEFQRLTADRKAKGFSVVHLVAGLFPDMRVDDPRNSNAGGPTWEAGFTRINPSWFDQADLKLQYLVEQGILPFVVGCWGYYLPVLGMEKMKRHWRYLVARWGAYPLTWCLAGEVTMPFYLTEDRPGDERLQREGWTQIGAYLRVIDPFHRPLTAHSGAFSASERELLDSSFLDFNFVQTAHGGMQAAQDGARHIRQTVLTSQLQPVVNGETCYEGILGTAWQDVQRFCFWSSLLSGAVGYSYGANGIWQINRAGQPYGPSPHGMAWGNLPWDEAMVLPGSGQLGRGARLLSELPFERLEAHPEWIEPCAGEGNWFQPYCAGIAEELYLVYFPYPLAPWAQQRPVLKGLNPTGVYHAFYFDPAAGGRQELGELRPEADGSWTVAMPNLGSDLVLVVRRAS